tara:strand:+ start:249 stop:734 length:486 start_codon:yes stop_codon:yes gene_type:complete
MSKPEQTQKNPNIKTVAGYKIIDGVVNVTGNQMTTLRNAHTVITEHGIELPFDNFVNSQLSKSIGSDYTGKWTQGNGSSSTDSEKMSTLRQKFEAQIMSEADTIINGKHMFIDKNGNPKECSISFTLRTPKGEDKEEYRKELRKAYENTLEQIETDNPINQ